MAKITYAVVATATVKDAVLDTVGSTFNCSLTGDGVILDLTDLKDGVENGDWDSEKNIRRTLRSIIKVVEARTPKAEIIHLVS